MLQWRRFYLFRLFLFNKWIGVGVFVFILINLAANLVKPTQITPIYNWNLYSYPLPPQDTFSLIAVTYNQGKLLSFERTWNEPQKVLFTNTMNLFVASEIENKEDYSKKHFEEVWLPQHPGFEGMFPEFVNFPSKREMKHFPTWYKKYLEQYAGERIHKIEVHKKQLLFTNEALPLEINSKLIHTIE